MGKKKRKKKVIPFQQNRKITYNTEKPNRQARRLGIKAEKKQKEKDKSTSKAAVLADRVQQARKQQEKITPPGMTYGEYMEYLKEKRKQLEEKKG